MISEGGAGNMRRSAVVVMGVFVGLLLAAAPLSAADVTGTWKVDVVLDAGSGTVTFVFKQDGEKLTGKYSGVLGEADVTGTVKGDKIVFSFSGRGVDAHYAGKVTGDTMEGTCEYGQVGSGTFKGKKQWRRPAPSPLHREIRAACKRIGLT
jgi:hypothetical protein